uniref:Odorant receptor n=1 Tax=Timema bartmani TaxID=61472 RepID=A0A7R9EP69_9NEOP|nr:unnamed protein product [Timema bartmani]
MPVYLPQAVVLLPQAMVLLPQAVVLLSQALSFSLPPTETNMVDIYTPCVTRGAILYSVREPQPTYQRAPVANVPQWSHPFPNITESSGYVEILPLKEWWPIDVSQSPGYELSYIFQVLDIGVHAIFFLSTSTICYGIVFLVTHRFKILQHVFENIKEVSTKKVLSGIEIATNNDAVDINGLRYRNNGSSNEITQLKSLREMKEWLSIVEGEDDIGRNQNYPNIPIFKSASSPMADRLFTNNQETFLKGLEQTRIHGQTMETVKQRFSSDIEEKINRQMMEDLKTAIQYHQSLLSSCRELETLINPILGADMLILLVVLCVSGFQLSLPEAIDVMNNIELLIVNTGLSLVFCSLVDELSLQSGRIGRSLYESGWLDTPQNYKKSILIIMTCSKRPVALTMVKCSRVTMMSFSTQYPSVAFDVGSPFDSVARGRALLSA